MDFTCILAEIFRIFDLLRKFLNGFRNFCLQTALEEHGERNENHQIEDQQQKLEIDEIGFDESLQVILYKVQK